MIGDFLANHPLGMALKAFLAVMLAAAIGDWATHGVISLANWQTWVTAAAVSVLPVVVNYLNPKDSRIGRLEDSASK